MDTVEVHSKCKEVYLKLFETKDGNSIGCDIWRAFVGENENFDNCIGENFNQLLWTIRRDWFENQGIAHTSLEFYNTTYLLWLYLVVARVYEVFDAVNAKKNEMAESKRMELTTFNEINLWAKFIKHPKEFIFCHWPEYICEGEKAGKNGEKVIINSSYLKEHYSSEQDKRPVKLKNNKNVVVQYPKLIRITEGFVKDFSVFRNFICRNEMVIDLLKKDTNLPVEQPV